LLRLDVADDESGKETATREAFECELAKAERSKTGANKLYDEISRFWAIANKCVLGYVLYAPPISRRHERKLEGRSSSLTVRNLTGTPSGATLYVSIYHTKVV
jgi:hypothetical protein